MNGRGHTDPTEVVDELLEAIWTCREEGHDSVECVLREAHAEVGQASIEDLQAQELVVVRGDTIALSAAGEERAARVVRNHRLAERLLVDVLGLDDAQYEALACSFEHSVVPEVADAICTLLGHPLECPHGKPIPRGADCERGRTEAHQVLAPLSEAPCALDLRVAYLRPNEHDRLHQLLSMGITPGAHLRVHQRSPVLVVQVDETEIAMDRGVASDVYVWLTSS